MATIVAMVGKSDTTYKAKVRIAGYPLRTKTFKSKTRAKEWARQEEHKIRSGEVIDITKEARQHTVKDVFEKYRTTILSMHSPKTARESGYILNWWERKIGAYTLANITSQTISNNLHELSLERNRCYNDTKEQPKKKKSQQTIKHYRNTLHRAFSAAVQWQWVAVNPVDQVPRITKLKNERKRFLNDDECKALLAACENSDNALLYPIVVFALSTGARKGEILNLTLSDINLKRDTATFHDTKNGETRTVPVTPHLKAVLEPHIERIKCFYEDIDADTHCLFPRSDGQAPIDIRNAWVNARAEAKIKNFRFHDLRHTAASYLAMNGATLLEIAAVLGHKTLQMVKRYSHISEQHTAAVVEKMNNAVFGEQTAEK